MFKNLRALTNGLVSLFLLASPALNPKFCFAANESNASNASTGYAALDDAAIRIKAPAHTPLVVVARVGQNLIAAGIHGVIVISRDNGATWTQSSVPVDVTLTNLYFPSPEEGWAVGHYGVVLHSTDGGVTWTKVLNGLDVIAALTASSDAAQAADPTTPAAKLKLRVATAFKRVGPNKPFLAIGGCAGGILAVGQQDMAMRSVDDGKTWQEWTSQINNPTFDNIYDITTDAAGSTFLIGENGLVLKSTGNCQNFATLSGPFTATLFGSVVLAPETIIMYGLDGSVFKSTDDGQSWTDISFNTDSNVTAAIELDSGKILVSTLGGNLYISDQKITAFHELSVTVPYQIAGMAEAPDGNLVIIGNGGAMVLPVQSLL